MVPQVLEARLSGVPVALKLAGASNSNLTVRQLRNTERELKTLQHLKHPRVVQVRCLTTTKHCRTGIQLLLVARPSILCFRFP